MIPKLAAGWALVLLGIVSVTVESTAQEGDHETSSTEKPRSKTSNYPGERVIVPKLPKIFLPSTTPVLSDSTSSTGTPPAPKRSTSATPVTTKVPTKRPWENNFRPISFKRSPKKKQDDNPSVSNTRTTPSTKVLTNTSKGKPSSSRRSDSSSSPPVLKRSQPPGVGGELTNKENTVHIKPTQNPSSTPPPLNMNARRDTPTGERKTPAVQHTKRNSLPEGNVNFKVEKTTTNNNRISKRYPPIQKMFQDDSSFLVRLTKAESDLLSDLKNCEVKGSQAFDMSRVSENDVMRILDDVQRASHDIKDKLIAAGGLKNLTFRDIKEMPVSFLPVLSDSKIAELSFLDQDKLGALCNKLMATGASPWTLVSMMESGINCIHMSLYGMPALSSSQTMERQKEQKKEQKKEQQRQTGYSVTKVMMTYLRKAPSLDSMNTGAFITVAKELKDFITANDITRVPNYTIRNSLKNISMVEFPFKSQVRTLIDKASAVFQTPTAWSEKFITDIGQLLDKVDINKIALLRNEALYNIAGDPGMTGIKKNLTKIVLAKSIHNAFKTRTKHDHLEKIIPWLRGEIEFIKSQDSQSVIDVFMSHDLSHVPFTTAEKHMFADKVEQMIMTSPLDNNTDDYVVAFGDIIEGFSNEFLEWVPDHLTPNITQKVPFKQISKARQMKRKLKRFLGKERLSAREAVMVFSGLDLSDLDHMTTEELKDVLPMLRTMDLPFHIGSKIVKKIERSLLFENQTGCSMAFWKLGRLAVHVSPIVLDELKYVPISLDRAVDQEDCPQNDIEMVKSQAYAVVDNVRDMIKIGSNGTDQDALSASLLRRLGRFVGGLTVHDIESMPLDTELLSIIEILSDYEDELTSAQNEAIAEKIRGYFDWHNRNTISEAPDIMIAQIGRFLQYLDPEFELSKFPTTLRPSISREIGKSSLLKISSQRRQYLLSFALKNAPTNDGFTTDLLLRQTITNGNIEDLGSLKCGLTTGIISKMSQDAIDLNLEDFQNCPLKDDIFEALIQKAVDVDINRLRIREGLGSIGPALQYLSDADTDNLNTEELASMTSFATSSMDHLDAIFEQSEKNGFTLENNSHNKGLRKRRRATFVNKLYAALKSSQMLPEGSREIHRVLQHGIIGPDRLSPSTVYGTALPDVTDDTNVNFAKCLEAVGTLPNWENSGARKMLKDVLSEHGKSLNTDTLTAMAPDMIVQTAGLLKGLTETEINHLNFSDINTVAAVGDQDLSGAQLQTGFNTWKSNQLSGHSDEISEDDLVSMQNFACGMHKSDIQNKLQVGTVRRCLGALGKRSCFKQDQMGVLTTKLADSMSSTPISQWKNYYIYEMGHLIGGLQRGEFQQLTKEQLQVIEPSTISSMAPDKVQDFTVGQLQNLSPNQEAAFTTMQRSFMSEEQLKAIGSEFINGAGQKNVAKCSVVVVLLSLLRMIVVHL